MTTTRDIDGLFSSEQDAIAAGKGYIEQARNGTGVTAPEPLTVSGGVDAYRTTFTSEYGMPSKAVLFRAGDNLITLISMTPPGEDIAFAPVFAAMLDSLRLVLPGQYGEGTALSGTLDWTEKGLIVRFPASWQVHGLDRVAGWHRAVKRLSRAGDQPLRVVRGKKENTALLVVVMSDSGLDEGRGLVKPPAVERCLIQVEQTFCQECIIAQIAGQACIAFSAGPQ